MNHSRFSRITPESNLSFEEILEGFSEQNTPDSDFNSRTNFEWTSVVENTVLLNKLLESSLQTNHFPSGNGFHRYAAQSKFSKAVLNKTSQENVPQLMANPAWNTLTKTAFEKINAFEFTNLNHKEQPFEATPQHLLPVFFDQADLKKIYRQRAKITHPDQPTGSHLQFIELRKNYQILMDFLKKID